MKYTKDYFKLWLMLGWALLLGTAGYFLNRENSYDLLLAVLIGVACGIYFGHSMGIVIYYLCKWRYPNQFNAAKQ